MVHARHLIDKPPLLWYHLCVTVLFEVEEMDAFIFAADAVLPIIAIVAIGYVLKRIGLMTEQFSLAANKLVFYVFLPCMLFLGVYKIEGLGGIELGFAGYALTAELCIVALGFAIVSLFCKTGAKKGVLVQAAFRSNYALIGIPLAGALAGDAGIASASLLSVVFVPMINVLAVIVLSVFGERDRKPSLRGVLLDILRNPLIISVLSGVGVLGIRALLESAGSSFRLSDADALYRVIEYLSGMATPMALLVLGARFEFSAVAALRREIILGTLLRTVFAPLVGIGAALLLFRSEFTGAHFAAFVCAFATPVAVASVPMSQEMGGDSALAGQLVVWTTAVSSVTLFLLAYLLRLAGVFS